MPLGPLAMFAGMGEEFVMISLIFSICHLVSFAWGFGYIAFFRTCHFIGFSRPVPYANAIQLLLTLKVCLLLHKISSFPFIMNFCCISRWLESLLKFTTLTKDPKWFHLRRMRRRNMHSDAATKTLSQAFRTSFAITSATLEFSQVICQHLRKLTWFQI